MTASARTERLRREAARALDAALRETDVTNAALGALVSVDERRVRRWRSDDEADLEAAPPMTVLLGCSWETFEACFARLRAARIELHGAAVVESVENQPLRVLVADAAVQSEIAGALADQVVQGHEVPGLLDRFASSSAVREQAIGLLRKRLAR